MTELNLGPFNRCKEDTSLVNKIEYPVEFYASKESQFVRVFYYPTSTIMASKKITKEQFGCQSAIFLMPTFEISSSSDQKYGTKSCDEVANSIALKIIDMIYALARNANITLCLDRIAISISEFKIYCDEKSDTPYGFAEIGIAIFS